MKSRINVKVTLWTGALCHFQNKLTLLSVLPLLCKQEFKIVFRNQIRNKKVVRELNYVPKPTFTRCWHIFVIGYLGNWACVGRSRVDPAVVVVPVSGCGSGGCCAGASPAASAGVASPPSPSLRGGGPRGTAWPSSCAPRCCCGGRWCCGWWTA